MENILHDFNEKVINLVTNYLKNSISDGGLSNFTDDLVKEFADLGTKTANFLVNYAEETIFKLEGEETMTEKHLKSIKKQRNKRQDKIQEYDLAKKQVVPKISVPLYPIRTNFDIKGC